MLTGVACAVGTSLCYGIGSVLQGVAAAASHAAARVDPRLLLRLLKAWPYVLGQLGGPRSAGVLGGVAGLAFGVVAVGARALSSATAPGDLIPPLHALMAAPTSYALLVAAPVALMTYATALQRGSVVQATAPLVVGGTVLPALVALTILDDHTRSGVGVGGLGRFRAGCGRCAGALRIR